MLGSPSYVNLLPRWLTNDTIPLLYRNSDLTKNTASEQKLVPTKHE